MKQHLLGGFFNTHLINRRLPVHGNLKELNIPGNGIKMQFEFRVGANKFRDGNPGRVGSSMPTKGNNQRSMVRESLPIILLRGRHNMRPDMHFD